MGSKIVNGVDVTQLAGAMHDFQQDPGLAAFRFHTRTRWLDGGNSQTTVTSFYGARNENDGGRRFQLEADEPPLLLGQDRAPNPVEHLLNALGTCMTAAMVYHAAARGIRIEACECELRGEIDALGFLGLAPDVRKGYQRIDARFRVKSDGSAEVLEACARFSPVLDVVLNGTEVRLKVEQEPIGAPRAGAEPEHAPAP